MMSADRCFVQPAGRLMEAVLLGAAAPEFRCMQNRTLSFWAKLGCSRQTVSFEGTCSFSTSAMTEMEHVDVGQTKIRGVRIGWITR